VDSRARARRGVDARVGGSSSIDRARGDARARASRVGGARVTRDLAWDVIDRGNDAWEIGARKRGAR